ncbi:MULTISPECIES: DUF350 domain-containing protein [Mycobacteriaceae]|jgi:uncharacterized membrane protein YjfL (UPF0719 family)|uniref:DUF350 domain-containing protein n=1 Tax=Mycobacteriaceae TaxID=1762 RepID=UPI0007FC569C|nr:MULTISPECIES: DUF350 domain-containing protein [Mycobacteriaceae]MCK0177476.1 DUF350 domain-containing protein [Mycolicibacterium sp. F2034L]OBB61543.1 hypothetical protein A5757_06890 [Mycobacterium sp. 852013-51886_SCH5428379]
MTTLALQDDYWSVLGHGVAAIALYAIVGLALIVLGFFVLDWTTPGPLRTLVQARRPNAAAIAASGLVSLSLVVVLAIFASSGDLLDGLIRTVVFGLLGIVAQAVSVRVVELITGIDVGAVLAAERYTPEVLVVVAAHFGLGLIVAASIL